jgi:hypothetical protein
MLIIFAVVLFLGWLTDSAVFLMQSVPCHNNIALCSMNLEKYGECIAFSKNVSTTRSGVFFLEHNFRTLCSRDYC